MERHNRQELINELEDVVSLRMAMVMAPVFQILESRGNSQLVDFLKDFGTDLRGDIEWTLSKYDIQRGDETDE